MESGRLAKAQGGYAVDLDLPGSAHCCAITRKDRFRLGREPFAKRMNRSLARIDGAPRKRRHHDNREAGERLGLVCDGWLDRFAVPASPLRLEANGAHDGNPLVARFNPPPATRPEVRLPAPEEGAGRTGIHVRICARGA